MAQEETLDTQTTSEEVEDLQQEPKQQQTDDLAEQLEAAKAEAEKWRTYSRDWEKKAKANKQAAPKLEDKNSEIEELSNKLDKALQQLEEKEQKEAYNKLVGDVAATTGLSRELVATLKGNTLEELTAAANVVKSSMPGAPVVTDGGSTTTDVVSKADILSIKNAKERRAAILNNLDKF